MPKNAQQMSATVGFKPKSAYLLSVTTQNTFWKP